MSKNLYELLKNGTQDEIRSQLSQEVYRIASYCAENMGEGAFGKVTVPVVGPRMIIQIDEMKITIDVVVKEAKSNGNTYIDDVNGDLIISSDLSLTSEGLMLFILSKCWMKSGNLHMPFLVGMGSCDSLKKHVVTHNVIERCGLTEQVKIDWNEYEKGTTMYIYGKSLVKWSYLATVGDLFDYMSINIDSEMKCELPNSKKVYFPEIIDNLIIFFLHTSNYLWENFGLVLGDQHPNNIFIHWQNSSSMCGKRSIANIENILYEIENNKYILVKTNGIIFKIGDIGCSIMNIQDNVMIVGDIPFNENSDILHKIKHFKNKKFLCMDAISMIFGSVPYNVIQKTKIFNIVMSNPILNKYMPIFGFKKTNPTINEIEILKEYNESIIDKAVDDDKNFVINKIFNNK